MGSLWGEKPNVVLVMADDIGLGDLSFYQREAGRKVTVETPNLDRMIAEGMRFTDAHAPASLCAPTRFSMLTGNWSYRNYEPFGVWNPSKDSGIDPKFTTIARIAKAGGYTTGFFGKWGLGSSTFPPEEGFEKLKEGALSFGFDYGLELPQGIQDEPYAFYENREWLKLEEDSKIRPVGPIQNGYHVGQADKHRERGGKGDSNWDPTLAGPILAERAGDFIRENAGKPFFIYYCSQAVHIPHTPPEELDGVKVAGATASIHGDMIVELDVQMGLLRKALEKAGVYERTLFVFTSDNGGLMLDKKMKAAGHVTSNGLAGAKGSIFEGGHRVPFLAVWPGVIEAGSVSEEPVVGHDMVATVAALAGQELDKEKVKDSMNLVPVFRGEDVKERHTVLMHQAMRGWKESDYALREGPWKLILRGKRPFKPEDVEPFALFNLEENLGEKKAGNLVALPEYQERVAAMTKRYAELRKSGEATVN
ncbi:MAG: arylsulfatase [Verrucomicrobiota bacterium]